jgi:hypothetical protein
MTRNLLRSLVLALTLAPATAALAAPKMPVTAADHRALAEQYHQKAGTLRQEARDDREMAQAYLRKDGKVAQWTGEQEARLSKMVASLREMAAFADKMADDAERTADYHKLRATEL